MAQQQATYTDLHGRTLDLTALDAEERSLLSRLRERAAQGPGWNEFDAFWWRELVALYDGRGISREESIRSPLYRVARDLSSRLAITEGVVRQPDYRDELADLIRRRFKTRRAFCDATGLSPDMLSHVLARRKHLSMESLQQALDGIGCALRIVPAEDAAALPTGETRAGAF